MDARGLLEGVYIKLAADLINDIVSGKIKIERVTCRYCGSDEIWKYGKNRNGLQRYKCPKCEKVFLNIDALPKMRVTIGQIGEVMGQYYGGMSYKELRRQFRQQHNMDISRSSFHRWLTKFSEIAVAEASKYRPKVGSKWIADECVLKVNGKNIWCWDIIDADTRFLLATHLSHTRKKHDAHRLMEKAAKVSGSPPKVVITDALKSYLDGIEMAFGSETKHIQSHPFAEADISTNLIERWHSTLRAREGIMRGLKSLETAQALLDGWLVHYNYFRDHESLDGRTPAQAAGIKFPYENWLDMINGQRVITEPKPEPAMELPTEQIEQWKHPTYKSRKKMKVKSMRKTDTPTTFREIRR